MTDEPITSFQGEYRWLSNFWPVYITMNGLTFPSTENAYQAMKSRDPKVQQQFVLLGPGEAKRYSRKVTIRSDWNSVRDHYMRQVTYLKYQDPELRAKLLATGNRELIEGNTWGDTYWGQCPIGTGKNRLGQILMAQRAVIRRFG